MLMGVVVAVSMPVSMPMPMVVVIRFGGGQLFTRDKTFHGIKRIFGTGQHHLNVARCHFAHKPIPTTANDQNIQVIKGMGG